MKRLLNTIKDIHVTETRHPLTIPAALVLGTAIAATALPLPSSTPATASGTAHVTRAYTDKSTHTPGTQATITGLVWFCGPGVLRVVGCYWWCCAHWRAYWLGESQPSALWGCSSL